MVISQAGLLFYGFLLLSNLDFLAQQNSIPDRLPYPCRRQRQSGIFPGTASPRKWSQTELLPHLQLHLPSLPTLRRTAR